MKKLPTNRRKEALSDRARHYAKRRAADPENIRYMLAMTGFQDGYRAAMRDARRAVNADVDLSKPTPASGHKEAAWDLFPTIRAFLRPLR